MRAEAGILDQGGQSGLMTAGVLLPLVYEELRRLAASKIPIGSQGHTLQPTALVHEAWLRLSKREGASHFQSRAHFFAAAAEAMRHILIDRARRKQAIRHGGGKSRVDLEDVEIAAPAQDEELLAVNDALEQLTLIEPEKAQLVKLRYFVGLNLGEAATALGISEPTAKRWWAYARAWLYNEIRSWPHGVRRGESTASTGVISQASENTNHEDLH